MISEHLLETVLTWPEIQERFRRWASFMEEKVEFSLAGSPIHTKLHCARVIFYALVLAEYLGLYPDEQDALGAAGAFHDSRRQDDWLDVGHGRRAADYYKAFCAEHGLEFDQRTYTMMAYHDRDDALGEAEMERLPIKNGVLLYHIFKDADALDRWRLGPNGLDTAFLRTEKAKGMAEFSKKLVEETSSAML